MADSTQHTETKPEPTAAQQRRARRWKLVERSFSMAAIVVVLVLGWSAMQGMHRLFSQNTLGPSHIDETETELQAPLIPDVQSALAAGGYWQMADWQWDIGVAKIAASEVDARLDALLDCPLPSDLSPRETQAIGRLIFALQNLPVERIERGELTEYRLEKPDSKIRIVSSGTGEQEMLVSLGAAIRDPNSNGWTTFELRSQPQRHSGRESAHILPLLESSRRICGRTDNQGRVLFELVETPVELAVFVGQLTAQGWDVSPFRPIANGQQISQILTDNAPGTSFLCEKENDLVHIWGIPSNVSGSNQLALMRVSK